jgi:hypothetical protein
MSFNDFLTLGPIPEDFETPARKPELISEKEKPIQSGALPLTTSPEGII